jgi:hypothetical protein
MPFPVCWYSLATPSNSFSIAFFNRSFFASPNTGAIQSSALRQSGLGLRRFDAALE